MSISKGTIMLFNDGKGRPQSFEAAMDLSGGFPDSNFSGYMTAYGSCESEALENMRLLVVAVAESLSSGNLRYLSLKDNECRSIPIK